MRVVLLLGLVGCAQAGSQDHGDPIDASGKYDAPSHPIDAPKPIDAPSSGNACASAATCNAATDLGSISGDTNNDQVMGTGYQAAWYKVRVTEDDSGVFAVSMTFTATLTSPANEEYDLFTYINTGSDQVECTTANGSATVSGNTQTRHIQWGESGTFSNGNDDSRTLSIEVRPKDQTGCMSGATYQLVIVGDT
ncbi:MAG: hypothetical protein QM831_37010 [Kofleriaceae bacterium]